MNSVESETEDAAAWIQVSIGTEQSRLLSPRTPALEKAQALQYGGGFFSDLAQDQVVEEAEPSVTTYDDDSHDADLHAGDPTEQNNAAHTSETSSSPRNALAARRRASSGPERAFENLREVILSLPKKLSLSQPPNEPAALQREQSDDRATELAERPQLQRLKSTQSSLRKSFSDESLALSRAFSQASSLGDDSRFEHIQSQVNSRMKAIRDSWQDSNIKLPSLSSFKPDIFRERTVKPVDPLTRQPFPSFESVQEDLKRSGHSYLDQALSSLDGDIIVLGGYRGSVLRSAKPPHKQLWVPIKVGLNLRKVDLEVGIEAEDDDKSADNVIADGMLKHIGPVDISARLFRRLRSCASAQSGRLRVHDYGYDWRLDPLFLSRQLCEYINKLGTKVTVIAHSLGGLITRHAVNQRPELFRRVVYAGVPTRCVNILGPLRNGDDVLLSSRVLTAQVNFTIRTSFALLPLDGRCFIDKHTGEEYPVDFFDPEIWRECRFSPCISRSLPAIRTESSSLSSYMSNVAKALPSLPSLPLQARKLSTARLRPDVAISGIAEPDTSAMSNSTTLDGNANTRPPVSEDVPVNPTVSTIVTIPPDRAFRYLSRMLARVKRFKQELAFRPELTDSYPYMAAIYGKNTPTVVGARVVGRDGIKRADAYEDLTFGSGDGVVLAKAAMPPRGYVVARGGIISSERGHVSLLADLDAVGRALLAVMNAEASQ